MPIDGPVNGSDGGRYPEIISDLERIVKANSIYERTDFDLYKRFQVFPVLDPYRRLNYAKEYVFFTKPDLYIYQGTNGVLTDACSNQTLFKYAAKYYKEVLLQLQYSADPSSLPFMNLLCNSRRSNLELPSVSTLSDIETPANIHGTKMTYRNTSYSADDGYEFSLEFEDSKYLEVYMLFKLYDEYENLKQYGAIEPKLDYVINKILHDQFSIYKFIVDEDFQTIVYWAKLTGVYPKSVPRDTFSDLPETGGISYSIQFKAQFVEDMKPEILADFNAITEPRLTGHRRFKMYDNSINAVNPDWTYMPRIEYVERSDTNQRIVRPRLVWYT